MNNDGSLLYLSVLSKLRSNCPLKYEKKREWRDCHYLLIIVILSLNLLQFSLSKFLIVHPGSCLMIIEFFDSLNHFS